MDPNFKWPKVNNIETNKDLTPFVNGLLLEEPFFGYIFRHVNFTADPKMPTAGVSVQDGDLHLYWGPEFMSSLSY